MKFVTKIFAPLFVGLLFCGDLHARTDVPILGQGERADWLRGSWGALWLPEKIYNGNIEGVTIDAFLAQIAHLKTIDYVQVGLACPNIYSPAHAAPHAILESLSEGDTDDNGDPLNLVVPRASAADPFLSWLEALNAEGLKVEVYVNSYNLLARIPDSIPDAYPDLSARWEAYCDTNPTVQAFINNHPYLEEGDADRRKYMFCYAEFVLKEYAIRYGDLIDAWCFDSADNIMEACGDDAASGALADQRIYEAFADACHAGNPNAAIAFNNSVGTDAAPFATPTLFDDYAFGHPFGGAGNMVVPEILYTRNFAICEFMSEHNGLPFATTDSRDWNNAVVGHFFPKQSTTSWNAGNTACLTDEQFVEWTAEGIMNGGAITWGTALVRVNLLNSPILELQPYALTQLELTDAHLSEFQFPDVPNWRRADTPLPVATSGAAYSHTLTDGVDFWDPALGSVDSLTMVDAPAWLSVAETSVGSGVWVLSGMPAETEVTVYFFDLRIMVGAAESSRTVKLTVNESPILSTESRTISGGAVWVDSGLELIYDNNGTAADNRAISYSTESFQSNGGFKLTVNYTTNIIGNNESHNLSFGLISDETDLATYAGFNPFAADTSVYSLGVNITTDQSISARGLNFTNGVSVTTLDSAGTNMQFVKEVSTPIVFEVWQDGAWSYSINGVTEATGLIPEGFDLSQRYHVVVYGQDDNGGLKSIQSMELERKPIQVVGLLAEWPLDAVTDGQAADISGHDFHGTLVNCTAESGVNAGAVDFNGVDSSVSLPADAFGPISNEITIALWVFGDTNHPREDSVLSAVDAAGDRVLNIHLPWRNSVVIWDAGTSGGSGYDRISKRAMASEYMERWNHWAFTKNASTGGMAIYLNGALWHSGTDKINAIGGITTDVLLGNDFLGRGYDGIIDEVKLYNVALSAAEVTELYNAYEGYQAWTSRHPSLENLEPDADTDQDGITSLLEYTLNGSPLEADQFILPTLDVSGAYFVFTLTRRAESASDTAQVFQYSSNLVDWYDLSITGDQASEVSVSDGIEGTEDVTVTVNKDVAEDGRLFGRLQVTSE
ncbi:LamG domain-containing protein [Puniceicoccaceae bacterium]|nr:LamG domain-containing protein [Puniceicoccaceae bacterium]